MKYILKNIRYFYKEEKLIFVLILVCSFTTALITFFSYGVGYNYNVQKQIGESSSYEISIQYTELMNAKNKQDENYIHIAENMKYFTFEELCQFLSSLNPSAFMNINTIYTDIVYESENTRVIFPEFGGMFTENITIANLRFLYDHQTGFYSITKSEENAYNPYSSTNVLVDGKGLTNDDFINGSKSAVVGTGIFNNLYVDKRKKKDIGYNNEYEGEFNQIETPEIIIGDQVYRIVGLSPYNDISVPVSSLSDETEIRTFLPDMLVLAYNLPVTHEQYTYVQNFVSKNFGDYLTVKEIDFSKKDTGFYNLMLVIIFLNTMAAMFNLCIMFRYIIIKRQKQIVVFKMCGCSDLKLWLYLIGESLLLIIPSFFLGISVYFCCIKPNIEPYFIYIEDAHTVSDNGLLFIFLVLMSLVFLAPMIYIVVRKFSSESLKGII